MKIRDGKVVAQLNGELSEHLNNLRKFKAFDPKLYVRNKINYLHEYIQQNKIDTLIVSVSGGVDSALVTLLLKYYQLKFKNVNIVAVTMPMTENKGVTRQEETERLATNFIRSLELRPTVIKMDNIVNNIVNSIEENTEDIRYDDWGVGQITPYSRATILYSLATLYSINGRAVIVGTTNRDEGAYLGYVGKASDGLVDFQIISDLHKSEVYSTFDYLVNNFQKRGLKVDTEIRSQIPTGDMFNAKSDEEIFGASYDCVELYWYYLRKSELERVMFKNSLKTNESKSVFKLIENNLNELIEYNQHKYFIGSPAIHFDLSDSSVPSGWENHYEKTKSIMLNNYEYSLKDYVR